MHNDCTPLEENCGRSLTKISSPLDNAEKRLGLSLRRHALRGEKMFYHISLLALGDAARVSTALLGIIYLVVLLWLINTIL